MGINAKRNAAILKLVDGERLSYEIVAEMMGTTRCAVAGVVFRHRHPMAVRVNKRGEKINKLGMTRNKIGTGYRPRSYWPEKTAANTR